MAQKDVSPKIHSIEWGQITVGEQKTYKDAKLFPSGSRLWDWNETGTHHSPGIQPADVKELLEHGAKVVVLSQGFHERLQVSPETTQWLTEQGVDFHILETQKAVEKYNDLRADHRVGALIHSTC